MNGAIQKFQTIGFMRGGRISGFLDGRQTPFYITKRLVDVPRIDEEGRAVRTPQWIIELEAPVDVATLLRPDERLDAADARATEAVAVLEDERTANGFATRSTTGDGGVVEAPASRPKTSVVHAAVANRPARAETADGSPKAPPNVKGKRLDPRERVAGDEAAHLAPGVEDELFERYLEERWGRG